MPAYQSYIQQEISMTPEQVQKMQRVNQLNKFGNIGSIILFLVGIMLLLQQRSIITLFPFDLEDSLLWYILPIVAIVIYIGTKVKGTITARDVRERIVMVLHTPLFKKEYEKDDNEYELHFEGVYTDINVSREVYDRMQEGVVYEVHIAKHSSYIFRVTDVHTKEVYV